MYVCVQFHLYSSKACENVHNKYLCHVFITNYTSWYKLVRFYCSYSPSAQ